MLKTVIGAIAGVSKHFRTWISGCLADVGTWGAFDIRVVFGQQAFNALCFLAVF